MRRHLINIRRYFHVSAIALPAQRHSAEQGQERRGAVQKGEDYCRTLTKPQAGKIHREEENTLRTQDKDGREM